MTASPGGFDATGNRSTRPTTLADLKPGDEIALFSGLASKKTILLGIVDRLTPTLIVLKSGNPYRKANGGRVGYPGNRLSLDPEHLAIARENEESRRRAMADAFIVRQEREARDTRRCEALARVNRYVKQHGKTCMPDIVSYADGVVLRLSDLIEVIALAEEL